MQKAIPFIRFLALAVIGIALSLQIRDLLPLDARSWASNSIGFVVGAEVYKQEDILALKRGEKTELGDRSKPENPVLFAKHIEENAILVEGRDAFPRPKYYVVPRLDKNLETLKGSALALAGALLLYFGIEALKK